MYVCMHEKNKYWLTLLRPGNIHGFSGGLSENESKYLNERDHKIYTAWQSMGRQVNLFSYMESGPGGIFWPKRDTGRHLEHPEKVGFLTERGRKRAKEWRDATFMKE